MVHRRGGGQCATKRPRGLKFNESRLFWGRPNAFRWTTKNRKIFSFNFSLHLVQTIFFFFWQSFEFKTTFNDLIAAADSFWYHSLSLSLLHIMYVWVVVMVDSSQTDRLRCIDTSVFVVVYPWWISNLDPIKPLSGSRVLMLFAVVASNVGNIFRLFLKNGQSRPLFV